ncbi:AMP-binding protein [Trinickia fusca]|uniref:Acyl-CoA synthetase n=1 Tax=Trinickia fusca TaxID=2419777 RepID=A0A494XTX8_9BURK|nr:AMP-binding protein [Trinickia fusca]RKP50993.1 acyl-CoA synthetase [Trinickia fusca]
MSDSQADLPRRDANFAALTPLDYIARAAEVHGDRLAVVHGPVRRNWRDTYARTRRLASALAQAGVERGDVVAVLMPNTPAMVEAHFGVPMAGAVLAALNHRLDAASLVYMLEHGGAKVLLVDAEFAARALEIEAACPNLRVIVDTDPVAPGAFSLDRMRGWTNYEDFLAGGDPQFAWLRPLDEWDAIALNYTSGTTGKPKGVVLHHRGAALSALSIVLDWDIPMHPVYLWTLPLFHCNGWSCAWALAARAGVNVCLRRVDAALVVDLMCSERVTHYCGAPIVQTLVADEIDARLGEWHARSARAVHALLAGAAPSPTLIKRLETLGIVPSHGYGLTETYGPAAICVPRDEWDALDPAERAAKRARQGVAYQLQRGLSVRHPETLEPVPADGTTIGELMFRGNLCMKGYLANPEATDKAFAHGWFHTGDLAVQWPDGYVQIKDRSKDIIISGGENISSIDVENALYQHPAVGAVAVVAMPDEKWGEVPCAFVETRPNMQVTADELIAHCRTRLAGFKMPKAIRFEPLPKTSTGKIQKHELRARLTVVLREAVAETSVSTQ